MKLSACSPHTRDGWTGPVIADPTQGERRCEGEGPVFSEVGKAQGSNRGTYRSQP